MQKQIVTFAVETKTGVIQRVGKSTILQPKVDYKGTGIKWFDDSKLLKKNQ